MNVESLLAKTAESEEVTATQTPLSRRSMKIIGASLLVATILAGGSLSLKAHHEEKTAEALYAQTAVVVDTWSGQFESIGESSIVLGGNKINDGAGRSIALSELRDELQTVEVESKGKIVNLNGLQINLKKDKSFTLAKSMTSEVVFDSKNPEG